MVKLEPCPCCGSVSISLTTAPGESRACGSCFGCGARGPVSSMSDPRAWDVAAAEEWNLWSLAKRESRERERMLQDIHHEQMVTYENVKRNALADGMIEASPGHFIRP